MKIALSLILSLLAGSAYADTVSLVCDAPAGFTIVITTPPSSGFLRSGFYTGRIYTTSSKQLLAQYSLQSKYDTALHYVDVQTGGKIFDLAKGDAFASIDARLPQGKRAIANMLNCRQ